MKKITLVINEDLCNALGITNTSDDTAVVNSIKTASDKAKQADEFKNKYETEKAAKDKAQNELNTYKVENDAKQCKEMLDAAQEGGKLTNELRAVLEEDYKDPAKLENVLKNMGAQTRIKDKLKDDNDTQPNNADLKAEFEKLDKNGQLADLAKNDVEKYKQLYKAKYGVEPTNLPKQ